MNKLIYFIRIRLFLIACAGFHTMWISLAISYFIDIEPTIFQAMAIICFIGMSVYFLIAFPKKLEEALHGKG
ncbi:hypothetical protein J1D76_18085 [Pseudomonas sp. NFX15]